MSYWTVFLHDIVHTTISAKGTLNISEIPNLQDKQSIHVI